MTSISKKARKLFEDEVVKERMQVGPQAFDIADVMAAFDRVFAVKEPRSSRNKSLPAGELGKGGSS